MSIELIPATDEDTVEINRLVNLAYRGDRGWTTETQIVDGDRSTLDEVKHYLSDPNAHLFVVTAGSRIIACICAEQKGNDAYLGYFAVHPDYQAQGLGKEVLTQTERFAREHLQASRFVMVVVSQRKELIDYYLRQGYRKTGEVRDYPSHLKVGKPRYEKMTIEVLEKMA